MPDKIKIQGLYLLYKESNSNHIDKFRRINPKKVAHEYSPSLSKLKHYAKETDLSTKKICYFYGYTKGKSFQSIRSHK